MGPQQPTWLDVATALGPYITAIIAIVGALLSAWLAQRNWLKRFGREQSVVLLNRRLDLAYELPSKLFEVTQLAIRVTITARVAQTLATLNAEGRQFTQQTIDALVREQMEAGKVLQDALAEALKTSFATAAFFDAEIYREASQCIQALRQLIQGDGDASTLLGALRQSLRPGTTAEQAIHDVTRVLSDHMQPINDELSKRIGSLAREMVRYAQAAS